MYYCATTGGFYSAEVHGSAIPDGSIQITDACYQELLFGQMHGMEIVAGEDGQPILRESSVDIPAVIAARRYQAETAGISVNGVSVDTGRDSQALITGASLAAMRDSSYSVKWKTADGFVQLGAEQILAVADAVRAHVQACFDREAVLLAAVAGNTYTADMLDEGWPT